MSTRLVHRTVQYQIVKQVANVAHHLLADMDLMTTDNNKPASKS